MNHKTRQNQMKYQKPSERTTLPNCVCGSRDVDYFTDAAGLEYILCCGCKVQTEAYGDYREALKEWEASQKYRLI